MAGWSLRGTQTVSAAAGSAELARSRSLSRTADSPASAHKDLAQALRDCVFELGGTDPAVVDCPATLSATRVAAPPACFIFLLKYQLPKYYAFVLF